MKEKIFSKNVLLMVGCIAISFFMQIVMCPIVSWVYGQECVENDAGTLDIMGASGEVGDTVTHVVRIQNAPNMVDSLGCEVKYDPTYLRYIGCTRGGCVTNFDFFSCTEPSTGIIRIGGFEAGNDVIPQGASCTLVELQFEVIAGEPGTCVTLTLQNLVDDFAGWTTSHGCFCIRGCGDGCEEDDSGSLDIKGARGCTGSMITHWVRIQNAPNEVKTFGFEIGYPKDALTYKGYIRGGCVVDFDQFDCRNPEPGRLICGGYEIMQDYIHPGETCDVVGLQFEVNINSECCTPDSCWTLDFTALYDQVEGWGTSHGCFCGGCSCDINGDGRITPMDAHCTLEMSVDICPTEFCGPCENLCCDVSGLGGKTLPDGDCTPADALCRFMEFLEIRPNCCNLSPNPECEGATCSTFIPCMEGSSCGNDGVCGTTAEGGGVCVYGPTPCDGLSDCTMSNDCPDGACFADSCCVRNVCVPRSAWCSEGELVPLAGDGPTFSGH